MYGWALVTAADSMNPDVGDLRVTRGRFDQIPDREHRVAQGCTVSLNWWRGQWFADRLRGVPYVGELLRKGVSEATVAVVLRRELMRVAGVRAVRSMRVTIDRTTRRCLVRGAEIVTTSGVVPLSDLELG